MIIDDACWSCGWSGHVILKFCSEECWLNDGTPTKDDICNILLNETLYRLGLS